MSKTTKASKQISYLTDKQCSTLDTENLKSDTQVDDISKDSSIHTQPFADNTQQSLSLTTNNDTPIPLQKKKRNANDKCALQIQQRSRFETKFKTKVLASLILWTHSSKFDYNKLHASNNDSPEIDQLTNAVSDDDINVEESYSYVDIKSQESSSNIDNKLEKSYSNVVEKQRDGAELLCNDSPCRKNRIIFSGKLQFTS
ncbi:unnamed protein product [Rotaria sp. Silwood2]|nr:unnamed protein product [Rotaria sp. Silwood2]